MDDHLDMSIIFRTSQAGQLINHLNQHIDHRKAAIGNGRVKTLAGPKQFLIFMEQNKI